MSGNVNYKPTSIEEVQKNWIELFLNLFSKTKVREDELQRAFEKEYGIRLPGAMMRHYIGQLEDSELIISANVPNIETERIESPYELTIIGKNKLHYLRAITNGEEIKMKGHRTIYTLRQVSKPIPAQQPKIIPKYEEAFVKSFAEKPKKTQETELPTGEELRLFDEYRMGTPSILEMLKGNEISGNDLKERVDGALGYTSQVPSFFELIRMLENGGAIRRIATGEYKQDLGKSKFKLTRRGEILLDHYKIKS